MKRRTVQISILSGVILAAAVAVFFVFKGGGSYLEGGEIRLIDALDDGVVQLSPLIGSPGATANPGTAPPEAAGGRGNKLHRQLRLSPLYVRAGTARVNAMAYRIELDGDTRSSLACLAPTRIEYKVRISSGARLRFSLGKSPLKAGPSPEAAPATPTRLRISVKRPWRAAKTIFSAESDLARPKSRDKWREVSIPLDEFAGQRVRLVIEAEPRNGDSPARDVFYLANPVLEPKTHSSPDRPNVIIVAADALRADHLSCYGYSRTTSPEIDRFSRDSILFEEALSQSSWTLPSFASLLTSTYPSFHGANLEGTRLLPVSTTLTGILRGAGYTTAACVRNEFLRPGSGLTDRFDLYCGNQETSEQQLSVIAPWLESLRGRPFFLFVHFLLPHSPYQAPPPFAGAFRDPGLPLVDVSNDALEALEERKDPPTPAELEVLKASYDETILYLDSLVGSLFEDFRKLGLYQDSLIVLVSDHGEQFWEHEHLLHAHTLYQEEIHVPLILKLPRGRGPVALRVSERVLGIDLMPSILDYLKIAPPPDVQGKNVLPLARGEGSREEVVFSELNVLGRTAAFKGRYKYITTDPAAYAQGVLSHGLEGHRAHPAGVLEEIYDLEKDPGETRNLMGERRDLAEFFRKEMGGFSERAARYRLEKFKTPNANRIKLSQEDKEKLRALGYLR